MDEGDGYSFMEITLSPVLINETLARTKERKRSVLDKTGEGEGRNIFLRKYPYFLLKITTPPS